MQLFPDIRNWEDHEPIERLRVLKEKGRNVLLGGHSVGMGSVHCVSAISVMTSHCTGATIRVVGKMGSGERA